MASQAGPLASPLAPAALARLLALLVPAALLGGALGSQYLGGLVPCEMCHWQRWPHAAAIALAAIAFGFAATDRRSRALVGLAAAAIAVSGAIGVFHAGVEAGWWAGLTKCAAAGAGSLADIMATPLVRCDQVQWSLLGLSMAGWNALISLASTAAILWLILRPAR